MSDLKDACDEALDDTSFKPRFGETFCNLAVMDIAASMGCAELTGLMADQIYALMCANASGKWRKVAGDEASVIANAGNLVIAAMSSTMLGESHGHVAACYPQPEGFSGSLNRYVPVVANIGKTIGVMKSSEAFPVDRGEAEYYAYS